MHVVVAYNDPDGDAPDDPDPDQISEAAVIDEADAVHRTILATGRKSTLLPVRSLDTCLAQVRKLAPDLVFNLCEGLAGQARYEMHMAAIWELLNVAHTGNGALTLGISQDKALSKQLFIAKGIPTPAFELCEAVPESTNLNFPLIAKPSREDASLGIMADAIIRNLAELQKSVKRLLSKYHQPILVEEYIDGREFNVAVLGVKSPRALPVAEICFDKLSKEEPRITSYEAKWLKDHPLYAKTPSVCPAPIEPSLAAKLQDISLRVYKALGGRGYGRVDLRMDSKENIFVLEFNPNPDISPDAGFSKALKAAGLSYEDFVESMISESAGIL